MLSRFKKTQKEEGEKHLMQDGMNIKVFSTASCITQLPFFKA